MLDLLKVNRVFKGCTPRNLQKVAEICDNVSFQKGETIFTAQTPADALYVVSEGIVELRFAVTYYESTQEVAIDRKGKEQAFGWSALLDDNDYTLSAVAVEDCKLVKIGGTDIKRVCEENTGLGYVIMKNIAETVGMRFELIQKILIETIQQNLSKKIL